MEIHERAKGDTLTTLPVDFIRDGSVVALGENDTVTFLMINEYEVEKIAETETGVQYTDRDNGQIDFTFESADVDTPGIYYGYFFRSVSGNKERFPVKEQGLKIIIHDV